MEASNLKNKWKQLYDLRCKVVHNTTFHQADFREVEKLVAELKPILQEALAKLATIEVSATDTEMLGWMLKKATNLKNLSADEREALMLELGDIIFAFDRDLDASEVHIDYLKERKKILEDQLPSADNLVENLETNPVAFSRQKELEAELKNIQSQIEDWNKGIKMSKIQRDNYDSLYRKLFGE